MTCTTRSGATPIERRANLAAPAEINRCSGELGIGDSCATRRPRSVMVTVSPATTSATTAEAFCFSALTPTWLMFFRRLVCSGALSSRMELVAAGRSATASQLMPTWVRIWYRTPFIDRYAHVWMWHYGGWDVTS